jgi:hypothetical protein
VDRGDEEVVTGAAAPRTFQLSWAECRQPLLRATVALYAPAVAPFVLSPLAECEHCVGLYFALLPVLPGFLAAWLGSDVVPFYALGAVATLAVLALTALLIALAGRRWLFVAVPVALLEGAQATGVGHLLRM